MKHKIFLFLLPVLAAAWLGSCHKDSIPPNTNPPPIDYTVLPPATQEGKNTFGCLVNGEVWVPRVELWVPWYEKAAQLNEKKFTGRAGIDCRVLTKNQDEWMEVTFGPTYFQTGIYHSSSSIGKASCHAQFHNTAGVWYSSDSSDSLANWVAVTLIDTVNNIVSGTFNFVLYKGQNKNEKITFSDGRFDMFYYPN